MSMNRPAPKPGPCPWCRNERFIIQHASSISHYGECHDCGACGPVEDTEEEAIAAWNTPRERERKLREALQYVKNDMTFNVAPSNSTMEQVREALKDV